MRPTTSPRDAAIRIDVPARSGRAVRLEQGQELAIIDVDGGQVCDVFAFVADDVDEYLSASHTRTSTGRLFPGVGESFTTTLRRPILTLVYDTSPGAHDMLIAACDDARYRTLGVDEHASCATNLRVALREFGVVNEVVPQPVNVFMNVPVAPDGTLGLLPALSAPGDAIGLRADIDCLVVVSACPMDINGINGSHPSGLALTITTPAEEF
jgi:uncharacterized protein